jgi:hypothetical protein
MRVDAISFVATDADRILAIAQDVRCNSSKAKALPAFQPDSSADTAGSRPSSTRTLRGV